MEFSTLANIKLLNQKEVHFFPEFPIHFKVGNGTIDLEGLQAT